MKVVIIIIIVALLLLGYFIVEHKNEGIIRNAKSQGVIIDGKHFKVYKIYRSSSYTDGGVYKKHHDIHDFKEIMLVSPDKNKLHISEKQLIYCLKVRKHASRKMVDGKMTNKWAEWRIDPKGWDEKGLDSNDIYLFLY